MEKLPSPRHARGMGPGRLWRVVCFLGKQGRDAWLIPESVAGSCSEEVVGGKLEKILKQIAQASETPPSSEEGSETIS